MAASSHDGLRKALFRSPNQIETSSKESDDVQQFLSMIDIDIEVESGLRTFKKELHEQNLTKLRRELKQFPWTNGDTSLLTNLLDFNYKKMYR